MVAENWEVGALIPFYVGPDDKFEFMYFTDNLRDAAGNRKSLMNAKTSIKSDKHINLQPIFRKNTETSYELELDYRCSDKFNEIIDFIFH